MGESQNDFRTWDKSPWYLPQVGRLHFSNMSFVSNCTRSFFFFCKVSNKYPWCCRSSHVPPVHPLSRHGNTNPSCLNRLGRIRGEENPTYFHLSDWVSIQKETLMSELQETWPHTTNKGMGCRSDFSPNSLH